MSLKDEVESAYLLGLKRALQIAIECRSLGELIAGLKAAIEVRGMREQKRG